MTCENVFLFVPNLIGFARVVLAIISFYFMPTHCVVAVSCYVTSALLDAVDGHAARYFNQSTKFGAILDQLTDRAGTAGLLVVLATFYPQRAFWLQLSLAVDITCHWLYLHASLLQGKSSHKFIDMGENPIMRLYYTNKLVLFVMCAANEAFYASLYVMHFYPELNFFKAIAVITFPLAVIKAAISVLHGVVASLNIATIDVNERAVLAKKD